MRIDRSHAAWAVLVALATAACAVLFLANYFPQRLPAWIHLPAFLGDAPPARDTYGGTPLGLIFGATAFLIFIFASALGIRKKKRHWPLGSVRFWLRAHTWLTILTIPLVLFHCGFRSGGTHTSWLMFLYATVMLSGFFGLALQQFMPRIMKERLPHEVIFEQIPHLRATILDAAKKFRESFGQTPDTSDSCTRALTQFLDQECIPYLAARRGERHALGNALRAANSFRTLRLNVDERWKPRVEAMRGWCDDRRSMDLQTKYQHWLHGWLLIHVPVSFALLIFTAWHAVIALRFLAPR